MRAILSMEVKEKETAGHIGGRQLLSSLHHPCFLLCINGDFLFYTG